MSRFFRVDGSHGREVTRQMYRNSGGFELVLSPALAGVIGYFLGRWLGTGPLLTVAFVIAAFVGVCIKLYYGYKTEMEAHEANGPWAKRS